MKWFLCIFCCCCCCCVSPIPTFVNDTRFALHPSPQPQFHHTNKWSIIHNVWGIFDAILMNDNFCSHLPFSPLVVLSAAIFEGVYIFYCIFFPTPSRTHRGIAVYDIWHQSQASAASELWLATNSTARDDSFFHHSRREAQLALLMLREERQQNESWTLIDGILCDAILKIEDNPHTLL